MSTARRPAPRFRVGDWVSFPYGPRQVWAQIIEDRGPLGVNRRRLYRIRVGGESDETVAFEVPEDDLAPTEFDRERVIDYLKQGGLIAILRSNLGGGQDQPKAWLAYDSDGGLTHTFCEERGLIGGEVVPFFALHENRISTPKAEEIIHFLSSFGLNRAEGEDVIQSIGVFP